ncbi:unnamed protein product, partial [Pylaiella littoralis]
MPNYGWWPLKDLKAEVVRIAGVRKALKFRPEKRDVIKHISTQKKTALVNALVKRCKFQEQLGLGPEWVNTAVGLTPEKTKYKEEELY